MPKVELPFEAILEATEQLDAPQLEVLVQRPRNFNSTTSTQNNARKTGSCRIWQQPILPPLEQTRIEELCGRLEDDAVLESERQELLHLDEKAMESQVRRLQAVVDLAHLRGVEPATLLDQLQPRTS